MIKAATRVRNIILPFVAACLSITISYAQTKPKAVSLDYCSDQFILSLADRDQIMALTTEAIESHSFYKDKALAFYKDKAQRLPLIKVNSEQILQMHPHVVIRNWGGTKMLPLLKRANIAVATAEYGAGPETLYRNIRHIGAALKQSQRAEDFIEDHKKRLAALKKLAARGLRAAYIAPGGITAGENTFVNSIIKLAGLASFSEEIGLVGWQPLPLEALVKNPPDIIIGSFFNQKNIHVSNWSLSRHGQIKNMLNNIPTIFIPGRYLSCNGIFTIDAAEYINEKLAEILQ